MSDLSYMRAVYIAPWRKGSLAKPSMVARRVDVAVRSATTFAGKAVLHPRTNLTTVGATFRGIGRICEDRADAVLRSFVGGEVLQLPKSPAVKPRAHSQSRLDAVADVGKVFHGDGARSDLDGLGDYLFAYNVVHVTHMSGFSARDFPQELLGALGAVELEASAQGKMLVTFVPELFATPDFARVGGGKFVFSDINPENGAGSAVFDLLFENKVEKPLPVAAVEFGFLRRAPGEQPGLMLARLQRNRNALAEGVKREASTLQGEGALVEMHRGTAEVDCRDRLAFFDLAISLERLVSCRDAAQHVATHLRAKRRLRAELAISQSVEFVTVPAARFLNNGDQQIACFGVGFLKGVKRRRRGFVRLDLNRGCPHRNWLFLFLRHLTPLLHVFGPLNVFADCLRAHFWHNHMVTSNCASRNRVFLPRLKSQVSNARTL